MNSSHRLAVTIITTILCAACGGGSDRSQSTAGTDTGGMAAPPPVSEAPGATGAAAGGTAAPGGGAAQPATGKTWDVKMVMEGTAYRFDPANLTIKQGDAVRWTVVSGPPHNVSFWPDSIPPGAATQLQANMPNTIAPLTSPLETETGATYTISFAGVPAGVYKYYCTPHLALGMVGQLTVQ